MKEIFLVLLIPLALYTIQTRKLRNAVITLGAFSLISSVVYLMLNAPDVAIAEAVIGTTLSTILYLVALHKYKLFKVYITIDEDYLSDSAYFERLKTQLTQTLEKFCAKEELELQILYSVDTVQSIIDNHNFAIIIRETSPIPIIYGHPENLKLESLMVFLKSEHMPHKIHVLKDVPNET